MIWGKKEILKLKVTQNISFPIRKIFRNAFRLINFKNLCQELKPSSLNIKNKVTYQNK